MTSEIAKKIEAFFDNYTLRGMVQGHILIQAGDEPSGIFYLVEGEVRQYDISTHGDEIVVNVFKPPAFFPMSWAINRTPNQYFFEAATEISYRQAPAEAVVNFLKTNPDVTFDLLSRLYSGTNGLLRRMAHLMGGNARSRLLFELVVECRRFGQIQPDGSYLIALSEAELAKRAGLSRETVSRELTKLRGTNLVVVNRQGLVIRNLSDLEQELGNDL